MVYGSRVRPLQVAHGNLYTGAWQTKWSLWQQLVAADIRIWRKAALLLSFAGFPPHLPLLLKLVVVKF
jgi:hypothetical protein